MGAAFLFLLAAAAGLLAAFPALKLCRMLHSRPARLRESLSLLVVAGSGKSPGCPRRVRPRHYNPQSAPRPSPRSSGRRRERGGHTTEILRLLGSLSNAYSPRHYVIADTDKMSTQKIKEFEQNRANQDPSTRSLKYYVHHIPRSREVQQSWLSSVFTTLYSMWLSLPLTLRVKPDLVLCNGPGTCVPICISALLLGILGIKKVIIVYVESICRVENLSLSGKILFYLSDYFIVQWPTLKEKYPKSVYLGRIV
ncbi:UDP-N-acetylglucosamine transferase subunit ALG14 homolog isoform X1 [Sorex araneus]|uniref:UDP-N-acetylglucosamine transferase subunit ALG14 homolog isoform X1 n=1 Tax=Sorex araneus TaxID=42254 RepID=UPI002433D88C|nr:UDP-N-acetylglucosamine transferase subunit ALG14 homolog isoform X1 [Sorex araneus]